MGIYLALLRLICLIYFNLEIYILFSPLLGSLIVTSCQTNQAPHFDTQLAVPLLSGTVCGSPQKRL